MSKFLKGNYSMNKKSGKKKTSAAPKKKAVKQDFTGIFEHKALEKLGGSIAFVSKSKKFVWSGDEEAE